MQSIVNGSSGTMTRNKSNTVNFGSTKFQNNALNTLLTTTNYDSGAVYLSASNLLGNVTQ
jgi:hypothetical protein